MEKAQNILKSKDYESAATKARYPYAVKKYSTEGKNIPLKENWSENWCILPASYDICFDEILSLVLRKDDVFVVTFMKSGTTWMQECAWLLLNNLDFAKSKREGLMRRSPYLEFKGFQPKAPGSAECYQNLTSPRLIKAHLPAHLLPLQIWQTKQKIIYVARNVKDTIVSSYHFMKGTNLWIGQNLQEFVQDFLNNEMIFTSYWSHVLNFWFMRHESFICFVTYEEMKKDLAGVLKKLCDFLERPQLSEEQLKMCVQHLSFDKMKENRSTNLTYAFKEIFPGYKEDFQFMRRGIVGSFKDELTPDLVQQIDKWTADILSSYGLKEEDIFGRL